MLMETGDSAVGSPNRLAFEVQCDTRFSCSLRGTRFHLYASDCRGARAQQRYAWNNEMNMKFCCICLLAILIVLGQRSSTLAQPKSESEGNVPPVGNVSAAKQHALDWLSQDDTQNRFGRIA